MHARHPTRATPDAAPSRTNRCGMPLGGSARTGRALSTAAAVRLKLAVRGAVQGVGFRPFVFRLAMELGLTGWVNNSPQGVLIEMEGSNTQLETFRRRLEVEKPPHSSIHSLEATWLEAIGFSDFTIRPSDTQGCKTAVVLPDLATCPECLREILDPANRRHRYPFTNCTHCGPRFSIIQALPYDRANTTMAGFGMCPQCLAEYDNPRDRRFHAQPNACPACGPRVEWWNPAGEVVFGGYTALRAAVHALRRGRIVAVKGVGGFHLLVDAGNEAAVQRLRARKQREEKPFALMFPSLARVRTVCAASSLEERLLCSPEGPIVLLRRLAGATGVATAVAPGNANLGVLLPSNPLHHLLMAEMAAPVVATSGNTSDEPMCFDEQEALERLGGIADWFLVHNRPIVRPLDDSIVRVMVDREMMVRRARGYAPLPLTLPAGFLDAEAPAILAVGAHLKNAIALAVRGQVFLSQHIGDLATEPAEGAFRRVIDDFTKLYEAVPETVVADQHPDYISTQFAGHRSAGRQLRVQHHEAHVLSCLLENEISPPALGVAWDGTGLGLDGTVWGGEFFHITASRCDRVAQLRPFRLPGGDKAAQEPRRAALGLLYEWLGDEAFARTDRLPAGTFSATERAAMKTMLHRHINSPLTSSVGRLFDAVAALTGGIKLRQFEGQAAMELEFALGTVRTDMAYPLPLVRRSETLMLDWVPMLEALLADVKNGVRREVISAQFHNALAEGIVAVARYFGEPRVALSGGCFQNQYLTERVVRQLQREEFQPCWHQRVPTNDGGIALGQIAAALRPSPAEANHSV